MSRFARVAALGLVLAASGVPTLHAADDVPTVGRFIQDLARATRLEASDATSAVAALRAAGVRLPERLETERPLTEGDVIAIARGFRLRLTTEHPASIFDKEDVDRFLVVFGPELTAADGGLSFRGEDGDDDGDGDGGPPFDPFSKGKGKGRPRTNTEP